jgi:hypothetical protein
VWNLAQPKGAPADRPRPGRPRAGDVVSLHCDVHPWMAAWVAVSDHRFFAVTGADGGFTLPACRRAATPSRPGTRRSGMKTARSRSRRASPPRCHVRRAPAGPAGAVIRVAPAGWPRGATVGLDRLEEQTIAAPGLAIRVLELPRLFNSVEELDYVADKVWPYYQKKFEKKGFTLQDRGEVGWVYFMTKSEPKSIDALKSSKMWLWGDDAIMKTTFKRLGMSGVPLGVPEVEPALTTGRIDGCYGSPLAAVALQWNTKIKYVTSMPISFSIGATIIKTDSLNKISADDQKLMAKIAKGMQKTLRKQIRKDNDSALKQMERKGVKVAATPEAMITDVDKRAQEVWAELTGKVFSKDELATVLKYRDEFRAKHPAK